MISKIIFIFFQNIFPKDTSPCATGILIGKISKQKCLLLSVIRCQSNSRDGQLAAQPVAQPVAQLV